MTKVYFSTVFFQKYTRGHIIQRSEISYNISRVPDYVKKCLYVCWFMTLQDPPLAFKIETENYQYFNKDVYKAFTKTGSYIEYIVWPPLLLHAGGPLLAKGVAQCILSSKQDKKVDSHETSNRHVERGFHNEPKEAWTAPTVTTVSGSLHLSLGTSFSWTQSPTDPTYSSGGDGSQQFGTNVTPSSTISRSAEADVQWLDEMFQRNAVALDKTNKNSNAVTSRSRNSNSANQPSSRASAQSSKTYKYSPNFLPEYSRGDYYK